MEKLNKIAQKIREIELNQPYDRRKKAYKEAEKQIEDLRNQAKMVILELAIKEMGALGYPFQVKKEGYARYTAVYQTPDKFTLYLVPQFSTWGWGWNAKKLNIEPRYRIQESLSKYARTLVNSEEKDFLTKVEGVVDKKYKDYLEAKKIAAKNVKNANDLYKLIKRMVSYKSYDELHRFEKKSWAGDRLRVEWESKTEWSDKAQVEVDFHNGILRVSADLRTTQLFTKDVRDFMADFEKLVHKYTDYIHKKEAE